MTSAAEQFASNLSFSAFAKADELKKRLLFTLGALIVFRIGTFVPIPGVNPHPPALGGMRFFGRVQYVGIGRSRDWIAFYQDLFGFAPIPDEQRFGIMPKGHLMRSPCGSFMWQLIEAESWDADLYQDPESLHRIGLGVSNVQEVVSALKARGVEFVDSASLHPEDRGALTRTELGSVSFEFVHQPQS